MDENNQHHISAVAWLHKSHKSAKIKCCISLEDTTTLTVPATQVNPWFVTEGPPLEVKLYSCKIYQSITSIRSVSLSLSNFTCSSDDIDYVKPIKLKTKKNSNIAVCGKFVYGSKDGNFLIEWFEFLRFMGVYKVVIYPYKLNMYATKVLRYYESLGMVDTVSGFDMPEKDLFPREVGEKCTQVFNDELIILKDCMIRLWNYKYIAVIDTDEFMIPYNAGVNGSWINFFDEYFKSSIASIAFKTSYHITSWKPVNESHPLAIGRHTDGTYPIIDRKKNVFMPSRVIIESVTTHALAPHNGYKKLFCPSSIASIHHFRECRSEWLTRTKSSKPMPKLCGNSKSSCFEFCKQRSNVLDNVAFAIEKNVKAVKNHLRDIKNHD
ncbi:unnamed protein product [Mytilus coruscus]|uniref:Glycosyltransferase family 92 protein n=1 Tax=Mytilus coruscus TaxID=42192 RepID=A0A6J8DH69_MYTCO|nr:unnamed protein product [Mytilus coruscus]